MNTGHNWVNDGLRFLPVNAKSPRNCRIGMTYVAGYRSRKFRLPSWLLARLTNDTHGFEWATISGKVAAFLMSWDMQLASIWANRMGVGGLSIEKTQDTERNVDG